MKYSILPLLFYTLMIAGCSGNSLFKKEIFIIEDIKKDNIYYENFIATGSVKFYVNEKKISSRFNFIKNKENEEIEFLDLFNNVIVTFKIEKSGIKIKNNDKKLNSEALQKIINRPIFKNIITNFSNILMCMENNSSFSEKYNNGLYRKIKNENYVVTYKKYNEDFLPVIMNIDFFNINFDLKIINWKIIE